MALMSCPECNAQVSDKAPACIHCGFPLAGPADKPRRASTPSGPQFEGIYVSKNSRKGRGSIRIFRADYTRGYIRFFEDGLMLYGPAIVRKVPTPAPFPPMHRSWGSDDSRYKWSKDGERLRMVSPAGYVSYARLDGNSLDWQGDYNGLFDFYEVEWPDH